MVRCSVAALWIQKIAAFELSAAFDPSAPVEPFVSSYHLLLLACFLQRLFRCLADFTVLSVTVRSYGSS
jgi:hypothetical protein